MRWSRAPAKINLTLRITGRRADGYHELESLIAFGGICDWLGFESGNDLSIEIFGPRASEVGSADKNLVIRAARSLALYIPELRLGRFVLIKRLPAAGGLGGGSTDAAAALRLLANESVLPYDDPRIRASALATGADVLACLSPEARMMGGIGDKLGPAIQLPKIFAVLVNPQVQAPTPKVFAAFDFSSATTLEGRARSFPTERLDAAEVFDFLLQRCNDLEAAAIQVAPPIAAVLSRLSEIPDARVTGMTGSGATCFALFSDRRSATATRRTIAAEHPGWWVEETSLH
jgi:4-diphosphocytidyl-2-C-methyl-D-erythritol kinase